MLKEQSPTVHYLLSLLLDWSLFYTVLLCFVVHSHQVGAYLALAGTDLMHDCVLSVAEHE
jgi:hypothetical protein